MDNERKEYTFYWYIQNYSFCLLKNGEKMTSSEFTAHDFEGTTWFQKIYPRGLKKEDENYISLYLVRSAEDQGPENFLLKFELSVRTTDGLVLGSSKCAYAFEKGIGCGFPHIAQFEKVTLKQDTLILRCRMWRNEGDLQSRTKICSETRIGIQEISFIQVVESFSAIETNLKKTVQIRYPTKDESILSCSVYYTDDACCEGKLMAEITPPSNKQILSKCELSLIKASGIVMKCGEADYRSDTTKQSIRKIPLSLKWKTILSRKNEYLLDDKLTLLCKCVFSSKVVVKKLVRIQHEIPPNINADSNNKSNGPEELSSALDDLKSIYNNGFLTNVDLKTTTKTFPAHKIVLCARSPVFKAMMSNDMKEKNTDCIHIDDLDDDIVHQLLLFLYSDHLGDLQWETATKLYYAADKYEIKKLKANCSKFLKDNLSTLTATELLILADTHNDLDLKMVVEDFILENEEEVFGSDEWEKLIETNPQLVIKTMHLKYRRNKVNSK